MIARINGIEKTKKVFASTPRGSNATPRRRGSLRRSTATPRRIRQLKILASGSPRQALLRLGEGVSSRNRNGQFWPFS